MMKAKLLKKLLVINEICTWLPPGLDGRKVSSQVFGISKLSYGFVCVILGSAVLVKHGLVTKVV